MQEKHCPNDGEKMLEHCPVCETKIRNPYARHCSGCGFEFRQAVRTRQAQQLT
jgi:predicted RNA-binding Zn-ribbon protein involved in translation (DUF1610 family)